MQPAQRSPDTGIICRAAVEDESATESVLTAEETAEMESIAKELAEKLERLGGDWEDEDFQDGLAMQGSRTSGPGQRI
eukprot:scaffold284857_cov33-Prasinocladus_malaysianus.AAC.1